MNKRIKELGITKDMITKYPKLVTILICDKNYKKCINSLCLYYTDEQIEKKLLVSKYNDFLLFPEQLHAFYFHMHISMQYFHY